MKAANHGGLSGPEEEGVRARLGRALREWRRAQGLPLKAISVELGVSIETISAWERGDQFPTPENLDALAKRIGVSACWFFCQWNPDCPANTDTDRLQV